MADWDWKLELTEEDRKKSTLLAVATGAGAVACIAAAVLADGRFWILMAVMVASILVMGRSSTSRLRSTTASIDGPVLTVRDSRQTTTIDLRTVEELEVRRRNANTGNRRWAVEATGDGAAQVHQLPGLEMYLELSEDAIEPLRTGLRHYHQWYRQQDPQRPRTAAETATAVMAPVSAAAATAGAVRDDVEWRPKLLPNAERNQRRVLITTLAIAGAIAAIAVSQNWGDTVAILLSIAVVPGIVLLLGLGLWYAYTPAKRFRLRIVGGELQVWRGQKQTRTIDLRGATDIVVDVAHSRNNATSTSTSQPYVRVMKGAEVEQLLLSFSLGADFDAEERLVLERLLKRHAGLT